MKNILFKWILTAIGLIVISYILKNDGFYIANFKTAIITVFIIGLMNITVKPIIWLLTLPINIITLGLFNLVINTFILFLAAYIIEGFAIKSLFTGFLASIILAVWGLIIDLVLS